MSLLISVCSQGSSAGHGDSYSCPLPQPQTYGTSLLNIISLLACCFSSTRWLICNVFCWLSVAEDLSSLEQFEVPEAGGWDATLSGEDEDDFFDLQIVKHYDGEVRMMMEPCEVFFPPEDVRLGNRVIS